MKKFTRVKGSVGGFLGFNVRNYFNLVYIQLQEVSRLATEYKESFW